MDTTTYKYIHIMQSQVIVRLRCVLLDFDYSRKKLRECLRVSENERERERERERGGGDS